MKMIFIRARSRERALLLSTGFSLYRCRLKPSPFFLRRAPISFLFLFEKHMVKLAPLRGRRGKTIPGHRGEEDTGTERGGRRTTTTTTTCALGALFFLRTKLSTIFRHRFFFKGSRPATAGAAPAGSACCCCALAIRAKQQRRQQV